MAQAAKDWQFLKFEHNGATYDAMYEHSDGCVSAKLFLPNKGDWSAPKTTHHDGPDPILTARMLFREIADSPAC